MHVAQRLAAAGRFHGDPEAVLRAPADVVMTTLSYVGFLADYEEAAFELNRQEPT